MVKAYKYRIMPTLGQQELINKHIGSCRFVYNLALETKQTAYAGNKVNLDCFDLIKQLPDLKKECVWLKEINSQSLQQSITHLDNAFTKFFKGQGDFPNFKKKSSRKSFNIPQNVSVDFEKNKLIIPKFRNGIKIILDRIFKGTIRQATISKTPTGKYFASILVENNIDNPLKASIEINNSIGIDLGIKSFLVTSEGEEFNNPRFLKKSESKLKYTQSKYSKYQGKRTRYRLAILHETIANQRKDYLNKISTKLIRENQTICLENLNIKGMSARCKPIQDENGKYLPNGQSSKRELNKSIINVGWGMFVDMLKYKAEWQGKNILQIGRFDPSSKTCNVCGKINKDLTLEDREWTCNSCNTVLDRDFNAAINIKNFALRNYLCTERIQENHDELPTLVGVMTHETHPIASGVGG
jgi:putative transposase